MNIWDLFKEEEERRVEAERKIIAAEDAAWQALPQAERDRINAEREAKWDALYSALDDEALEEELEDELEDEEEDNDDD
jgi:hypothetical protein